MEATWFYILIFVQVLKPVNVSIAKPLQSNRARSI